MINHVKLSFSLFLASRGQPFRVALYREGSFWNRLWGRRLPRQDRPPPRVPNEAAKHNSTHGERGWIKAEKWVPLGLSIYTLFDMFVDDFSAWFLRTGCTYHSALWSWHILIRWNIHTKSVFLPTAPWITFWPPPPPSRTKLKLVTQSFTITHLMCDYTWQLYLWHVWHTYQAWHTWHVSHSDTMWHSGTESLKMP
jgi:hypothetical protein